MKHRKKEKIDISSLRCINLGGLMHMLTSGNTCTHTCELARELATCFIDAGSCTVLPCSTGCVQRTRTAHCRASAQKHGKDAYFGYC